MTEILTSQEVCEYLRIAKPTLYRYVRAGRFPGFKTGKTWKFNRSDIEKWMQGNWKCRIEGNTKSK